MVNLYHNREDASFAFIGAAKPQEDTDTTQRFRIYRLVMQTFFKPIDFQHIEVPRHSLYMLVNMEALRYNNKHHIDIWNMLNEVYEL
ncbi:hypothetical protein [uncultured Microscilla sp.]|uniref:hypothetical protein n=1 Tax=uncultured Microscilla sp. TaxID=432653 RepID=UPI002609E686|nr:hypothetical protein [uncultured Microscilla sp.]